MAENLEATPDRESLHNFIHKLGDRRKISEAEEWRGKFKGMAEEYRTLTKTHKDLTSMLNSVVAKLRTTQTELELSTQHSVGLEAEVASLKRKSGYQAQPIHQDSTSLEAENLELKVINRDLFAELDNLRSIIEFNQKKIND